MPTYKIRGINVDFPYEAYDCQVVYMEKVIQSLQERSNALLESPTGTGKTLCLLCATLAWRKSLGEFSTFKGERRGHIAGGLTSDTPSSQSESNLPSIVYTSRTHSQLRQVIQELKRTSYRPKMVVLGSREQFCIHEEVSLLRGRTQTNACHSLCKKRKKRYCSHFPCVAEFMKANPGLGDEPIDIEDLISIGKSCGPCPYYMSRELHKAADIVFAPYNYLIDPGNRKSLSINWHDSVLIFDEAHNLEGLCADAASFDMPSSLLTACISEAKNCVDLSIVRRDNSNDKSYNPDNFAILRALLLKIEKRISELPIESKEFGLTKPGPYIYELLAELNITYETATMLMNIIEDAVLLLEEDSNGADSQGRNKMKANVCRLENMGDILKIVFRDGGRAHADYYRFHVQEVEANAAAAFKDTGISPLLNGLEPEELEPVNSSSFSVPAGRAGRTLSWWCFNPGLAMEEFSKMGVRSIILTSGTLSPMDSFAHEFKLDFPVRLENPHVISANQIWAGVVPVGPTGHSFNSSYRTRDSLEYKTELGNAIVNFSRIVPDGLLVFFPSYYLLEKCIECWKNQIPSSSTNASTIWERICKNKQPVVEPRQSSLFALSIDDYMSKLKDSSTSGAVFFAVCRGKVSEGLDFADHAGRAVIITGMPFAMRHDPKVRLKREYLDQQKLSRQAGSKILTGEEWYGQQASRAVNQAVGRVIRHRHDYGAIIFCDERFAQSNRQSEISRWIQPHIKSYSKFGDIVFTLTRFFRDGATRGPTKMEQMRIQDGLGKVSESKPLVTVNKLEVDDYLAPLTQPIDSHCNLKSMASMSEVKDNSGKWQEIVPANRSSLVSQKNTQNLTLKRTGELLYKDKESVVGGEKNLCCLNNRNSSKDGESKQSLIVQCSLKKPKRVFSPTQLHVKSYDPNAVVSSQNAQTGSIGLPGDMKSAEKKSQTLSQNHTGAASSPPVHRSTEERQGSDFLSQVKEKLDHEEYKEFVGFMRAIKSKAVKINEVLQSIVNLFSTPDRLPLLQRFKDYIPATHHRLYEECLTKK